jgi:hypothetical protein
VGDLRPEDTTPEGTVAPAGVHKSNRVILDERELEEGIENEIKRIRNTKNSTAISPESLALTRNLDVPTRDRMR